MEEKNEFYQKIIAIQGDPLAELKLNKDSSLFIASELCRRGYEVFWYEPAALISVDGEIYADGQYISVKYSRDPLLLKYKVLLEKKRLKLSDVACIMVRQDPPFDMSYITSTILLSLLAEKNKRPCIVNNPAAIRNNIEKILPLSLSHTVRKHHDIHERIAPRTITTANIVDILNFLREHETMILKPLYSYGGDNVIKVELDEKAESIVQSYLSQSNFLPIVVQEFIPEVIYGDKRVITCDGEIIGIIKRTPQKGSFLTNTAAGATLEISELTDYERKICNILAVELQKMNIFLAGIDLLNGLIIEINVTSPSLLIGDTTINLNIHKLVVDRIEKYIRVDHC